MNNNIKDENKNEKVKMKYHNKNMKKIKKSLAVLVAILLICFVGYLTIGFLGNPFERISAKVKINKYIEENYKDTNIKPVDNRLHYEFKFGSYYMDVYDSDTIDTSFAIYYRKGKIDDERDFRIHANARQRLENKYKEYVGDILKAESQYNIKNVFTMFDITDDSQIAPEQAFDINLDIFNEAELFVTYDNLTSVEEAADKLKELDMIVTKHNLKIKNYTVECEFDKDGNRMAVYNITHEDALNENLVELLNQIYQNKDENDNRFILRIVNNKSLDFYGKALYE